MLRFVLFVAICVFYYGTSCHAAQMTDCGSKVGSFSKVSVTGCTETQAACELIRNTNATIGIDFTSDKENTAITAVVHGIILDIEMPFNLPHPDVCSDPDSGVSCPLPPGSHHYQTSIHVDKVYPKVSVIVKWQLLDENKDPIVCVKIPARIK